MTAKRTYFCIDMKTFYASVECAERGLNPFETNLVVTDRGRGKNALCLAVTPKLKAAGVSNRCRLSDIPCGIDYIVALPQMNLYEEYAADIYSLYLDLMAPEDIYVYSIDEAFIDATDYLKIYGKTAVEYAQSLMRKIFERLKIPSTAGIGNNLYLAKVALDISAKKNKSHIAVLDEQAYIDTLWHHRPITDFWQVGDGIAARLAKFAIYDMAGVAQAPTKLLFDVLGKNAELLIDHAWGREPCTLADIKAYIPKTHSLSSSQILSRDYTFAEARIVIEEMARAVAQQLMSNHGVAHGVHVGVHYSKSCVPATNSSKKLGAVTALCSKICETALKTYDETANRRVPIRRLEITLEGVVDESLESYDLFTDPAAVEKEKRRERAVLEVKRKYGKNAVVMGIDHLKCATQRERNTFIGGHRAGDDKK